VNRQQARRLHFHLLVFSLTPVRGANPSLQAGRDIAILGHVAIVYSVPGLRRQDFEADNSRRGGGKRRE
jgi:hypothetical protein